MNGKEFYIKSNKPASWVGDLWKEAFPSGNGKVGIAVYGAVKDETIVVNHGNLWHWGVRDEIPDVSDALKETRQYLESGRYKEANFLTSNALLDKGYKSELYSPCPVGSIHIRMQEEGSIRHYERVLNMESGEIDVRWQFDKRQYSRRCFVSRVRDMIVFSAKAEGMLSGINVGMNLHDTGHDDTERMKSETASKNFLEDGCLIYISENEENGRYGIAARVIKGDCMNIQQNMFSLENIPEATVLFKVFGSMDASCQTYQDAISELLRVNLTYEELLSEHENYHSELFHSAELSLGDGERAILSNEELLADIYNDGLSERFCEILWNYGRYLFISGTNPSDNPFNMYGLWGGRYKLLWSHNMANINLQMMYWHCVTGGYTEYIKSVIDYYFALIPNLRENAQKVFGMEGIFLPAGTTPGYGLMNQIVPVIVNWIGGAGWVAQHMYEYYLATGDEEYLKDKILPFMLEAELFYEQYLVWEDGLAKIMPSVSPENTPGNLQDEHLRHMSHANPTAVNATMDIAIIKELTENLIELAEQGKCGKEKLVEWKRIEEGLPDYDINDDGAVKEWQDKNLTDFYYHRHLSHIYPLFPGREILKSRSEKGLEEAFKRAVELRILGGQTGWSLASQASTYARLKDGNKALESLELLAMGCLTASFISLHNDWRNMGFTLTLDEFDDADKAPVQMDANMGIVNAVQEMLLQYAEGLIKLLPSLPDEWNKGYVKRFGFFGGTVDMEWDIANRKFSGRLTSNIDQNICVVIPKLWDDQCINFLSCDDADLYSELTVYEETQVECNLKKGCSVIFSNS